mgnify:CR=1 FL=1
MTNWMKNLFKKDEEKVQVLMLPESDILEVRDFALNGWTLGETINPPTDDIIEILKELLKWALLKILNLNFSACDFLNFTFNLFRLK